MSFIVAKTINDALDALAAGARPVAGGSDLVVGARNGAKPLPDQLVAIDQVSELRGLTMADDTCTVGAAVTHAQLMIDPIVSEHFPALADAAALIGSPATRNVGTLGGNVMNGSPAMDTGAPLMVLNATVQLRSKANGSRSVPISEFWTAPGQTSAADDELCVSVALRRQPERSGSAYVRLEYRRAMEIAVVGAAASVTLRSDGTVDDAAVALTAVAPTIVAVADLDAAGQPVSSVAETVASLAAAQAAPISDLRASDEYRRHTVGVMARRAFESAAQRAAGAEIATPINRSLGLGVAQ